MQNTKKRLHEYWDELIYSKLPPAAHFTKVHDEVKEHYFLIALTWKRVILPLVVFYVVMSFVFDTYIAGSLFLSLLIFIYGNFIPDSDIFIKTTGEEKESLWYEKYFILCFAPVFLYYILKGEASPVYSREQRPFHNLRAVFIWTVFLYIIGSLFWPDILLKRIMFAVFGSAGFLFHLSVDGVIKFLRFLHVVKTEIDL